MMSGENKTFRISSISRSIYNPNTYCETEYSILTIIPINETYTFTGPPNIISLSNIVP